MAVAHAQSQEQEFLEQAGLGVLLHEIAAVLGQVSRIWLYTCTCGPVQPICIRGHARAGHGIESIVSNINGYASYVWCHPGG